MAKTKTKLDDLLVMAKKYGVEDNALFLAAAEQYALQQHVIEMMKAGIEDGDLTTQKTYLKGQANAYAAPLVKELPKHSDAANKTASIILDIIVKLGHEKEEDTNGFDCN